MEPRHKACIDNPKKNLLNSSISSTCSHNMVNFGLLAAEIGLPVWGTPANFNGFRVLASLLHRCRSTEINQTLHDVWPSPGLVHSIYTFGGSCPITEFCQVQNSLCVQVLRSILAALVHGTRAVGVSQTLRRGTCKEWIMELSPLVIFNRGRHLYSEGSHHVGHRMRNVMKGKGEKRKGDSPFLLSPSLSSHPFVFLHFLPSSLFSTSFPPSRLLSSASIFSHVLRFSPLIIMVALCNRADHNIFIL